MTPSGVGREDGVYEDGVFYYGARSRPRLLAPQTPAPVVEGYDADAPEEINARRFFGFTDYEPLDLILLRARYIDRKHHRMAQEYFRILYYRIMYEGGSRG